MADHHPVAKARRDLPAVAGAGEVAAEAGLREAGYLGSVVTARAHPRQGCARQVGGEYPPVFQAAFVEQHREAVGLLPVAARGAPDEGPTG